MVGEAVNGQALLSHIEAVLREVDEAPLLGPRREQAAVRGLKQLKVAIASNGWQPIETAPTTKRVDLWAKRWNPHTDTFDHERFTDCYWMDADPMCNREASWWVQGVKALLKSGWRPTHWMAIPEGPEGVEP